MENKDLIILKKHFGEDFARLCRELFSTILEREGLLSKIILDHFAPSRSLYNDLKSSVLLQDKFKEYIFSFVDVEKEEVTELAEKTAEQIMDEAGYILYPECKTEDEIQEFKKYWQPREALCTFNGGRLNSCRVWFAIKKGIDKIKREDFDNPQRQDEYGTSAISIQFSKGNASTLSIKNRYNHTVNNPDATFGNNLDNIAHGLTQAFLRDYNINNMVGKNNKFEMRYYTLANDGRFYRYNIELNGIYYCENNVIIHHGEVQMLDKSRYIVAENYIIDKKFKIIYSDYDLFEQTRDNVESLKDDWSGEDRTLTITLKDGVEGEDFRYYQYRHKETDKDKNGRVVEKLTVSKLSDSFVESIGQIEKIEETFDDGKNKVVVLSPKDGEPVKLTLNERNEIIGYENLNATHIGDNFLNSNREMRKLIAPNVKIIGEGVLERNDKMQELTLEGVESIKKDFLFCNASLKKFVAPKLKEVGNCFLQNNEGLKELALESLEVVGNGFLRENRNLTSFIAPRLRHIGEGFLCWNMAMEELTLENVESVERGFLTNNLVLKKLVAPKLREISSEFLISNKAMEELTLESVETIGYGFLELNQGLKKFVAPKLREVGSSFLERNLNLEELTLESLTRADECFLMDNTILKKFVAPKLKNAKFGFLAACKPEEVEVDSSCTIDENGKSTNIEKLEKFKNILKYSDFNQKF